MANPERVQRPLDWLQDVFLQTITDPDFNITQLLSGIFDIYGTARLKGEDFISAEATGASPGSAPFVIAFGPCPKDFIRHWFFLSVTGVGGTSEDARISISQGLGFEIPIVSNNAIDFQNKETIGAAGLVLPDKWFPMATYQTPQVGEDMTFKGVFIDLPRGEYIKWSPPTFTAP